MLTISINHPDSPEFIRSKQDLTKVTGANISVKITNDFMQAVIEDKDYVLRFPCDWNGEITEEFKKSLPYNELVQVGTSSKNHVYYKKIKAKELWDELIHCAWNTAEPGIIFEDNHIDYSPDGVYEQFKGISTNPCGRVLCLK